MEEYLEMIQKLRSDPDYSKGYDSITDLSEVRLHYTSEEIKRFTKIGLSPVKVAIVAPSDISYGMSRMFEMLTDGDTPAEVRVFRDIASAATWLGRKGIDIEAMFEEIRDEQHL